MPRKKELNQRMREESINRIVVTSTSLFAEKGFFKCKMTEIAESAGMSVGNLYWYYQSKEEVLKAVLQAGFKQQEALLADTIALHATAEQKMDHLLDRYLALCREQGDFFSIIMNLLGSGGAPYINKLGFDTADIGKGYHLLITKLLGESTHNRYSDEELTILPVFFFSLFCGLITVYGNAWQDIEPAQIKAAVKRLLNWKG